MTPISVLVSAERVLRASNSEATQSMLSPIPRKWDTTQSIWWTGNKTQQQTSNPAHSPFNPGCIFTESYNKATVHPPLTFNCCPNTNFDNRTDVILRAAKGQVAYSQNILLFSERVIVWVQLEPMSSPHLTKNESSVRERREWDKHVILCYTAGAAGLTASSSVWVISF